MVYNVIQNRGSGVARIRGHFLPLQDTIFSVFEVKAGRLP